MTHFLSRIGNKEDRLMLLAVVMRLNFVDVVATVEASSGAVGSTTCLLRTHEGSASANASAASSKNFPS